MPQTPTYGLQYPAAGDAPNVPADMQALAEDVEAKFVLVDAEIASVLPSTVASTQAATGTTTSTTFTATLTGGTACSVVFTAPDSGKTLVLNNCECLNSGSGFSVCTIQVRTGAVVGSGTLVLTASDNEGIVNTATNSNRSGTSRLLEGLTPGAQYNVQQLFRVQSGTGTFLRKHLIATPQFA